MVAPRALLGGIVALVSLLAPVSSQFVATRIEECWADSTTQSFVLPIYQTSGGTGRNLLSPTDQNSVTHPDPSNPRSILYIHEGTEMELQLNTEAINNDSQGQSVIVGDSQICTTNGNNQDCRTLNSGVCKEINEREIHGVRFSFPSLSNVSATPGACNNGSQLDSNAPCQFSSLFTSEGLNEKEINFEVKYFLDRGTSDSDRIFCAKISVCRTSSTNPSNPCQN
jgi:hypothetical protein